MSRIRITIPDEKWRRACQYAKDTNRTPSELVNEALDQIQARYPKKRQGCAETDLDVLAVKIAARLGLNVPAGTFSAQKAG